MNYCHHLASVNLAGMFLGWSSTKVLFFVPVGYSTLLPGPIICSDWLKFQRSSYQISVFYADRKSKMAATAGHRLTLDPMGKCSNAFFSETTNMIKAKPYMNIHWKVLYKFLLFMPIGNPKGPPPQDID